VRILLVDDDVELCSLLTEFLKREGFTLECDHDGKRGLEKALHGNYDIVLLDVMLPGMDGFEILRMLRKHSKVPVIMLTARGEDVDRIIGLELGADDYLPKPFNPRELVARIHAVLRRHTEAPGAPSSEGRISFGPYVLDLSTRTLVRGDSPIVLTTGEFSLLKVLATHPRQPLAREKLMLLARGRDHDVFDRAIDVQISRLRKLIEPDPSTPRYIQTVWGFGYVFVPDEAPAPSEAGA
jgi:two-component system, OmpR family, phosphate regulon response regulator OmpR